MKSITRAILALFSIFLLSLTASAFADEPVSDPSKTPAVKAEDKAADAKASDDAAASAEAKKYTDLVQAYYDAAQTYSAAFSQEYLTVDGIKKESTGVVWFKKPGMMRWDYETPEARFLISDGKSFWSWEPVYRQYCRQDLSASQLPTALTFLSGQGRIEDDFTVAVEKVDGSRVSLRLTPKHPSLSYNRIDFEILLPSAKVYRVKIYDAMGNTNRITFKSPEINAPLDAASFHFDPPADATHICE